MTHISPPLITKGCSMIGCKHNIQRTIVYPEQVVRADKGKNNITFAVGQDIHLICPKGCKAVMITITEGQRRGQ